MVQQFEHDSARFWNFGMFCCVRIYNNMGVLLLCCGQWKTFAQITMYPDRVQTVTTSTKFQKKTLIKFKWGVVWCGVVCDCGSDDN